MKTFRFVGLLFLILGTVLLIDNFSAYSKTAGSYSTVSQSDQYIFPHDQVIDVNITIDQDAYEEMLANASAEEYIMADITYNGVDVDSVAIRPKGNSSLNNVVRSGGDRFSFKIDFDYYINEQNLYGVKKINLNNLYSDPTMMAEHMAYEMLHSIDAHAPRTTYTALHINGEYYGLYLAVEQVDETFLIDHFNDADGELYKPDMGTGSDLKYQTNTTDYSGLYPENMNKSDNKDVINLMKTIASGEPLDDVLYIDSFAKYLAMSASIIHLDAYQGGMFHNYFLYNLDGKFQWISWDLNMTFNGFPKGGTDEESIELLIDEPVLGSLEKYPLIESFLSNEDYVSLYHSYIDELLSGYLNEDTFNNRVLEIYDLIKDYVKSDTNSFYTYEEFEDALFTDGDSSMSIMTFVKNRNENLRKQLSGEIPSTNNGEGNTFSGGKEKQGGNKPQGDRPQRGDGSQNQAKEAKPQKGDGSQVPPMREMPLTLPEGVTLDDIPEEFRSYFEEETMPSMESMMDLMNSLPEDIRQKFKGQMGQPPEDFKMGGMRGNKEDSAPEVVLDPVDIYSSSALLVIGMLAMIFMIFYFRKR